MRGDRLGGRGGKREHRALPLLLPLPRGGRALGALGLAVDRAAAVAAAAAAAAAAVAAASASAVAAATAAALMRMRCCICTLVRSALLNTRHSTTEPWEGGDRGKGRGGDTRVRWEEPSA